MATWTFAEQACKFGEDIRRDAFPPGEFVRFASVVPVIPGFQFFIFNPSVADKAATDWKRA